MSKLTGMDVFTGAIMGAAFGSAVSWMGTKESDTDSQTKKENDAVFKQVCVGVGALVGAAVTVGLNLLDDNN